MRKLRTYLVMVVGLCVALAFALPAAAGAATPGNISGKVTDAVTGDPVPFVEVCAYESATDDYSGCYETNFEGEYLIADLAAGHYKVEFEADGYATQWYSGKTSFAAANSITVSEGATTEHINAALQEIDGKISGTVTDAGTGAPIGGIEVCAEQVSNTGYYGGGWCEQTNAAGQYTLEHVEPASYRVEFYSPYKYNESLEREELEGPNYVSQYYSGQARPETATPVGVSSGATTGSINAALQPGATISGTVTDAVSNGALQEISVCAWGASEYRCAETGTDGNYSIPTLPAGSYKVEFTPEYFFNKTAYKEGKRIYLRSEFPLMEYARQFWNDKATFEAAEAVTATAGQTIPGISAKLSKLTQPPAPVVVPSKAKAAATATVKGGKAELALTCSGTNPCKGSVKLTARVKSKKKTKEVVIGKGTFAILPGKTKTVSVKLSGTGKSLLAKAGKKGLKVKVAGAGLTTGMVVLKSGAKGKGGTKGHK